MKKLVLILFLFNIYGSVIVHGQRPNVIVVLSDDQGYGDFSCHGNPVLKTPALDKMHDEGVRFSNFHVTPLCTPTRGQLMTGLQALNNKASNVLTGRGLMRRDIVTMPEVFRDNGYHTGVFGKWHLGDVYPDRPMDRGFQKSIWTKGWGLLSETEFDNDYYKTRYMDGFEIKYSDKYCSDLWFDEAIAWMDDLSSSKKPFFTYIALNAPHGPFHSPKDEEAYYRTLTKDSVAAAFFGMISNIDKNMAKLDEWLIKKNLKNNTLVVFMNDNGGTGGIKIYNAGMRGEKTSTYDGGHRAACFINWPGGDFGGSRTIDYPSNIMDLLPTFIDLFGFKLKKKQSFDGMSLKKVLREPNKKFDNRMFVVQYTGKEKPEKYFSCVVWDNWRLVGANELYDISTDPGQQANIAATHPATYKKMKDYYDAWWAKLEPVVFDYVPVIIGNEKENPVLLSSNGWAGAGGINTQWGVAQNAGTAQGGTWHLQAEADGVYRLELSRWPPHIKRALTSIGPDAAVGGTWIRSGKAVPIVYGCASLNNNDPVVVKAEPRAEKIIIEMKIKKGANQLNAWFRDAEGKDNCAAYYVTVEKIR